MNLKSLLIPLLATSALTLAGCSMLQSNSNVSTTNANTALNVNTNTNAVVVNTNTVVNENGNTNAVVNTNATEVNSNTNSNTGIDTSDWKTYTDTKYTTGEVPGAIFPKFTMKYPETWILSEDLSGPYIYTPTLKSGEDPKNPGDFAMVISYVNSYRTAGDCLDFFQKTNASIISNIQRLTWDNTSVISFEQKVAERPEKIYCLEKNGTVFSAEAYSLFPEMSNIYEGIVRSVSIDN